MGEEVSEATELQVRALHDIQDIHFIGGSNRVKTSNSAK